MPVKWTPENDQLLLLKILETSSVHADTKAIAAAWPKDRPDQPTARAITERLVKIRKDCKANSGAHFSVSSAQNKNGGGPAANGAHRANNSLMNGAANGAAHPETPHRGRAAKENGAASLGSGTGSSTGKRKRNAIKIEDDDEGEEEVTIVGSHQRRDVAIKREDAGERAQEEDDSPTKRVKAMDLRENDVFNDAVYVPQPYSPYYDEESGEEAV